LCIGLNRHEAWSPFLALHESEQLPGPEPELLQDRIE
jgi:hypothetical protein